jgi:hypothetical protein
VTYDDIALIRCTTCGVTGGKKHHWGQQKAQNEGWFFQKNGDTFCPEHVPAWVGPWRASR